jgi:hypothetical protein
LKVLTKFVGFQSVYWGYKRVLGVLSGGRTRRGNKKGSKNSRQGRLLDRAGAQR